MRFGGLLGQVGVVNVLPCVLVGRYSVKNPKHGHKPSKSDLVHRSKKHVECSNKRKERV